MDETNKKLDEIIALLKEIREKQQPNIVYVPQIIRYPIYPQPCYPPWTPWYHSGSIQTSGTNGMMIQ